MRKPECTEGHMFQSLISFSFPDVATTQCLGAGISGLQELSVARSSILSDHWLLLALVCAIVGTRQRMRRRTEAPVNEALHLTLTSTSSHC